MIFRNIPKRPAADRVDPLSRLGVPTGPVLRVPEILEELQILFRGLIHEIPGAEALRLCGTPAMIDGDRPVPESPATGLGADNAGVWAAHGLEQAEIEDLRPEGLI
ncbi:hypothetical protein [Ponticoccus alexandrii]|uniref:CoA transferase n=1 Tax=Ponticoccus alexandrii TaxID=1943633 RepID=A0ABX7F7G7_9RHOB|nr:hypothetical protein [Ponticoccus alexandrii]ETA50468.1 hypothetical protein P279_19255 [Rhodobacteraceae bacterium PD-2]QRF65633.1 hypothetical protein GQA70_04465 [Ponticoccus alexandrii]